MPHGDTDTEARLAELLEEAMAELRAKGNLDIGALRQRSPEHADEVLALVQTLRELDTAVDDWKGVQGVLDTTFEIPALSKKTRELIQEPTEELYDFLAPAQESGELGRMGMYRVLRVIGAGGMGVVFVAEDPQLKRLVALKVMKPALAASRSAKKRFLREAQAMAAIDHDHIVTVYQVGEERGIPFLAMQLLQGQILYDRIKKGEDLSIAEIVQVGRETAEGLAAAHACGLVHRDIKPTNLWLETREVSAIKRSTAETGKRPRSKKARFRVKILDFGLARGIEEAAQVTQPGIAVGTPDYMSPEQARGAAIDHRTDLFSLGCVLYRLCTGVKPFRYFDLLTNDMPLPRSPCQVNRRIPQTLSDLTMQLLAEKPGDRPESAQAVVETFNRISHLLASPSNAPPPAPVPSDTQIVVAGGRPSHPAPAPIPPPPKPDAVEKPLKVAAPDTIGPEVSRRMALMAAQAAKSENAPSALPASTPTRPRWRLYAIIALGLLILGGGFYLGQVISERKNKEEQSTPVEKDGTAKP